MQNWVLPSSQVQRLRPGRRRWTTRKTSCRALGPWSWPSADTGRGRSRPRTAATSRPTSPSGASCLRAAAARTSTRGNNFHRHSPTRPGTLAPPEDSTWLAAQLGRSVGAAGAAAGMLRRRRRCRCWCCRCWPTKPKHKRTSPWKRCAHARAPETPFCLPALRSRPTATVSQILPRYPPAYQFVRTMWIYLSICVIII